MCVVRDAPSRPTPRGQLCRPPHGRPHTRMGTQERFTAPDRDTASTQVYMYLTTLAHPHMGLLRVPPRVAVSVRTDLASAAHSAPRPSAVSHRSGLPGHRRDQLRSSPRASQLLQLLCVVWRRPHGSRNKGFFSGFQGALASQLTSCIKHARPCTSGCSRHPAPRSSAVSLHTAELRRQRMT